MIDTKYINKWLDMGSVGSLDPPRRWKREELFQEIGGSVLCSSKVLRHKYLLVSTVLVEKTLLKNSALSSHEKT